MDEIKTTSRELTGRTRLRKFTRVKFKDRIETRLSDHQVFLSFTDDIGTEAFRMWLDDKGVEQFFNWLYENDYEEYKNYSQEQ